MFCLDKTNWESVRVVIFKSLRLFPAPSALCLVNYLGLEHLFFVCLFVYALKEQNSLLENIAMLLRNIPLEGRGEEGRRMGATTLRTGIQYCLSRQIAVGIGAVSQVLNNTLDQGQINERVLLSNRI